MAIKKIDPIRVGELLSASASALAREQDKVMLLQSQLATAYETLRATLPALVRLGDFVGNIDKGGASGLGTIDRCALIARVKNVLPGDDPEAGEAIDGEVTRSVPEIKF